ncbi:MAG: endonuclease III [Candidatus Hydrogenedentes bacterium]|nr:endonuclease III [Candidatus Hydrogenedentota bacterium]
MRVFEALRETYPDATCSLDYRNPLELMVATILAAQCTDERVNVVTKTLFKKYRTPQDYVNAPREELEKSIQTCGFFRQKAKSIANSCAAIMERFGGSVPGVMDELTTLPGVGRKTANVILGQCFGVPGVIVDTHCTRVSNRLGFTRQLDPAKIEQDLMKLWPRDMWTLYSHFMVFHGRAICQARKPRCSECPVAGLCPSVNNALKTASRPRRQALKVVASKKREH